MLNEIYCQEIIKELLCKIKQQRDILHGVYNVLSDLAEQEFYISKACGEFEKKDLHSQIEEMAMTAAKERTALDKYLRGEIYAE